LKMRKAVAVGKGGYYTARKLFTPALLVLSALSTN
jgi:hypothetical protein